MLLSLRISALVLIVILAIFFVLMLRKKKLDLKYCLVWLFGLFVLAIFCIFPGLLAMVTSVLGLTLSVNAFFLMCIVFLGCISISLTIVVSRLSSKLHILAQDMAILKNERTNESAECSLDTD